MSRKRAKWRRNAFGLNDRILQAKTHSPRQCLPSVGSVCCARVALGRVRQEKSQNKSPELPDIEPCDKLRALRLSSAEFQRKFCPLFLPLVGASCSYTSNSKREAKKQGVRDAYPLLFGSPCWTRTSDTLINSQVLYRLS